jgi:phosphatidylglycerol---prolipoprotein diacylglyceryl transferase
MIPYFFLDTISAGPLTFQVWGLFVSFGASMSLLMLLNLAKKRGLARDFVYDLFIWLLLGGILGARIVHVLFYEPMYYFAHPAEMLAFWQGGASSLGGFLGAAAALMILMKINKLSWRDILPYADLAGVVLWLGWAIGRLGCFMIHDHPGIFTNNFFAVNFPGGTRFDLGLVESGVSLVIFFIVYFGYKKWRTRPGLTLAIGFWLYSVVRFFLDFLRARDLFGADIRYGGLTPAQWGMAVLFVGLTLWLWRAKIQRKKSIGEVA